jgi:hypothetical protein
MEQNYSYVSATFIYFLQHTYGGNGPHLYNTPDTQPDGDYYLSFPFSRSLGITYGESTTNHIHLKTKNRPKLCSLLKLRTINKSLYQQAYIKSTSLTRSQRHIDWHTDIVEPRDTRLTSPLSPA